MATISGAIIKKCFFIKVLFAMLAVVKILRKFLLSK